MMFPTSLLLALQHWSCRQYHSLSLLNSFCTYRDQMETSAKFLWGNAVNVTSCRYPATALVIRGLILLYHSFSASRTSLDLAGSWIKKQWTPDLHRLSWSWITKIPQFGPSLPILDMDFLTWRSYCLWQGCSLINKAGFPWFICFFSLLLSGGLKIAQAMWPTLVLRPVLIYVGGR